MVAYTGAGRSTCACASRLFHILSAVVLLGVTSGPPRTWAAPDPATRAIDAGVEYLLPATDKHLRGLNGYRDERAVGQLALQVYALLVAGVAVEHPTVRASFAFLFKMKLRHIYTISCYAFALDAALNQLEGDLSLTLSAAARARLRNSGVVGKPLRKRLGQVVAAVASGQNETGGWSYHVDSHGVDNSNTQFAVLALGVGARRGMSVSRETWLEILGYFVENQEADGEKTPERVELRPQPPPAVPDAPAGKRGVRTGVQERQEFENVLHAAGAEAEEVLRRGWDYRNGGGSTWNMTCAGLSSLLVAKDYVGKLPPQLREDLVAAIRDGYGWIMGNWDFQNNYYGMYSLEKVADLGSVLRFGPHDWYREISEHLIQEQKDDGRWAPESGHWNSPPVSTSLALLILNRATSLLTSNPVNRMVISGQRTGTGNDSDWVYLADLDTRVHYPSVLRNLKLRPSARLTKFVRVIVESYPPETVGELVPPLLDARDELPHRRLRKTFDKYLTQITGLKSNERGALTAWHERWKEALEIGRAKDRSRRAELLSAYREETTAPLKKVLIWALEQIRAEEALPLYLDDMAHDNVEIRAAAYSAFRGYFVDAAPRFEAGSPESTRKVQLIAVRKWLGSRAKR